jgi:hypothetical protein|tara:strand:+ start:1696 stop:1956 length:261 start_codon:yes stop_codon:yes gene_type:complete
MSGEEKEYDQTLHIVRNLIGLLIEDGCDAVVLSWSRTTVNDTTTQFETYGNKYAVGGLAHETLRSLAEELGVFEDSDVEIEEDDDE